VGSDRGIFGVGTGWGNCCGRNSFPQILV
jgi:ribose 5-phosphate isomerase RpiB